MTWNGWHLLAECLHSLRQQSQQPEYIYVVDNGSSDQTIAMLKAHHPEVHLLALPTNTGFSIANNQALRLTTTDYVALINNDVLLDSHWIQETVHALDTHPAMGSCAAKMLSYDQRSTIDSAGILILSNGVAVNRGGGEPDSPAFGREALVFGACAGAALYRMSMLREVGFFDEDFYLYYEDVDLAYRAQWAGYDCLFVPTAIAFHHHSASTRGRRKNPKDFWLTRNSLLVIAKNIPGPLLRQSLRQILIGQLPFAFYAGIRSQPLQHARACLSALSLLPRTLQKRRSIQKSAILSPDEMISRLTR